MTKYTVTVRAVYVHEAEIEAEDEAKAKVVAMRTFKPDPDELFSMDVFGLDPWQPIDGQEDYWHDTNKQRELDDEA